MLCRKKLVLFLTLTTLGLMYISANHYLSENGKNEEKNNEKDGNSEMVKAPPIQTVMMSKKTQLEKYLQPSSDEENVEFRTANPIPAAKKISKFLVHKQYL